MMKKYFLALCALITATSMMAQLGKSCSDPIPVDSNYEGVITEPGEYWFTAWTYDLPLNVHFIPDVDNSTSSPEVLVDFTCTPGIYDDEKLGNVINNVSSFGLDLPVEFRCAKVERYGKIEWDLSINANYREELTKCGITYNVQAFVKVKFTESGKISLKPDTTYMSCMDNAIYVNLGDTLDVAANDNVTFYAFPYSEWCKDSIQFVWTGDNAAKIWVSDGDCDFTPTATNVDVRATYDVTKTTPYKLYEANMDAAIKSWLGGGVFFAKVISKSAGKLIVEKIPMGQIQGGAILLQHDVPVQLAANDSRVFCFPRTWTSTEFVSPTQFVMSMYTANTSEFAPSVDDANVLNKYDFSKVEGIRVAQLSTADIANLVTNATDDYIYVRFTCNQATTLTPKVWTPTSCADKSILIQPDRQMTIMAKPNKTIYRLRYNDWKDYDMTLKWEGYSTLPTYFADACEFTLSSSNSHVMTYKNIKARGSYVATPSIMAAWASKVDEDGFIYVRFNPTNEDYATFTSAKPAEQDPETPVTPDPVYTTLTDTVCYGVTYEWNDQKYTTSGEYSQTFTAANGADSVVTLTLVVLPEVKPVVTEQTIEYGKSFEWNNKVYTQSTTDTVTLQNEHGCDYLAILKLTVLDKPAGPCVLKSIELKINDQLTLNLDSAFTIYRINYSEWVATGATLTWTGVEPLHTFVAETCEFAVAPYNKYVHAYVSVPAEGALAMTKAMLADMVEFVDEDGYLYVRFLTEQEGVLEVK